MGIRMKSALPFEGRIEVLPDGEIAGGAFDTEE